MDMAPRPLTGGRYHLLLAGLGLAGACLVLFATSRYGLGASPDSVVYVSVARSLIKGGGLADFTGSPLVMFPPVYPALLAAGGSILGRDPVSAARFLNALLFGLLVYLSGLLSARYLAPPRGYAALATLAVLLSVPLVPVAFVIWTEPLFICVVLVYFLCLESHLRQNRPSALLILTVLAGLACLIRYVGAVLIVAGVFSLLMFSQSKLSGRLRDALLFGSLSSLPLFAWAIRNFSTAGTFFGPRTGSAHTYLDNVSASWNALASWYVPPWPAGAFLVLIFSAAILAATAVVNYRGGWRPSWGDLPRYGPLIAFCLVYWLALIASSQTAYTQIIDNRYLSPIFVPLTILLIALGRALFGPLVQRLSPKHSNTVLLAAMALWTIYPAASTASAVSRQLDRGLRYTSRAWRESQTMRYVRDHPSLAEACAIYSNAYDGIYLLTGVDARPLPVKSPNPSVARDPSILRGAWPPEGAACLVQFDEVDTRPYLFTTAEILANTRLDREIRFDDGAVYFISRK